MREKAFWRLVSLLQDLQVEDYASCTAHPGSVSLEEAWLSAKAAIWAVAHAATSSMGAEELEKHGIISLLVNLAENCPVLCLQGTAFYALGELNTVAGGFEIFKFR